MEKKLSHEEYVRIKNLLTKVKGQASEMEHQKAELYKTIDEINEILNNL